MDVGQKRQNEKQMMEQMVALYCRGNHGKARDGLCEECAALLAYAGSRTDHCPHMAYKTFCSNCTTPCYSPENRQKVREVMRYAGPRMLLHHPVVALRHAVAARRQKPSRTKGDTV